MCRKLWGQPYVSPIYTLLLHQWLLLNREAGGTEQRQKHVNVLESGKSGINVTVCMEKHRSNSLVAELLANRMYSLNAFKVGEADDSSVLDIFFSF